MGAVRGGGGAGAGSWLRSCPAASCDPHSGTPGWSPSAPPLLPRRGGQTARRGMTPRGQSCHPRCGLGPSRTALPQHGLRVGPKPPSLAGRLLWAGRKALTAGDRLAGRLRRLGLEASRPSPPVRLPAPRPFCGSCWPRGRGAPPSPSSAGRASAHTARPHARTEPGGPAQTARMHMRLPCPPQALIRQADQADGQTRPLPQACRPLRAQAVRGVGHTLTLPVHVEGDRTHGRH